MRLPRKPGSRVDHAARCVHDGDRSDRDDRSTEFECRRCHSNPALHPSCTSTRARTDRSAPNTANTCGTGGAFAKRGPRPIGKDATSTEIKDHGCRYDRHHLVRVRPDGNPELSLFEIRHHAVRSGQPVRAPAGEADGMDSVDEVAGVECIGLTGPRAAAAYIHGGDCAVRNDHSSRAGLPAAATPLVMSDKYTIDIRQ